MVYKREREREGERERDIIKIDTLIMKYEAALPWQYNYCIGV